MKSFCTNRPYDISASIISVDDVHAIMMTDISIKRYNSGNRDPIYCAVKGFDIDGKAGKWAIHLHTVWSNGEYWHYVTLGKYRPRKEGKAEYIFTQGSCRVEHNA